MLGNYIKILDSLIKKKFNCPKLTSVTTQLKLFLERVTAFVFYLKVKTKSKSRKSLFAEGNKKNVNVNDHNIKN